MQQPLQSPHPMGRLTLLSFHSQLQEAEVRNRDLEAHVRQLQERMEMLQAPGAAGESLTHFQPEGCWVEMGHLGCVSPRGRGGVQAGAPQPHHCPSSPSTLHTPLSSPSSCHGGPQSPGHGSTFPCKTPLFPPRTLPPTLRCTTHSPSPVHI